jgi:hypothetical protein
MKTKTLVIGAVALTAALAGGWALAQSVGPPGGSGPPFMHGQGTGGMGPGTRQHMGSGMGHAMMEGMGHGPGMMMGMGGHGPGMMRGPWGAARANSAQLAALKGELGITAAQETAWSRYATAVQDAAAAMQTTRESLDPTAVSKMTPSDRFAFVSKMREQAQKQFEAVRTAANELLAVLDDTQKAKADNLLPGLASGQAPTPGPFAVDQMHKHHGAR